MKLCSGAGRVFRPRRFDALRNGLMAVLSMAVLTGCQPSESRLAAATASQAEFLPGGAATLPAQAVASFIQPVANLPEAAKPNFYAGKALAEQPWVKAPTATTARDGLGPVYNARACLACHTNGGRGHMPVDAETPLFSALLRISLPGHDVVRGVYPEPTYGDQIQGQSVSLAHQLRRSTKELGAGAEKEAPPEAYVFVDWQSAEFQYPDGQTVMLRRPEIRLDNLGYGELDKGVLMSLRNAPAIPGAGLLERISQADINALADPDDANKDGISGRVNRVWNAETGQTVPGRFGWKANRPDLRHIVAGAFANDIGITNPIFPEQPCTALQKKCLSTPAGAKEGEVELPADLLELVVGFTRNLGVATRRGRVGSASSDAIRRGQKYFHTSGCAGCHQPGFKTAVSTENAYLGNQQIWPYTDLLLHDMGPDLADGRPDFEATGREWRTPPLWGIGLSAKVNGSRNFLHDGRARSVEEAILWHGGEAIAARQAFAAMTASQRDALLHFVRSL